MSFVPALNGESKGRPRLPRPLEARELRVLGSLMEKQLSTPEYYPLTLNALVAACNQKSNREPVMELSESDVQEALERLQDERLVWKVMGGRAVRFDHNLDTAWSLRREQKALLTLLFLRGPQTAAELRSRSERLHRFDSMAEAEGLLEEMGEHSEPLVRRLPRRPGQKEERWMHTAAGVIEEGVAAPEPALPAGSSGEPLSARLSRLEERVEALASELRALKQRLGED